MTLKEREANCLVYGAGALAYLDTFAGMVPCRVLEVIEPGNGIRCSSGRLRIRLMRTVGAYKQGEILEWSCDHVVPRAHRVLRGYHYRISTNYRYK